MAKSLKRRLSGILVVALGAMIVLLMAMRPEDAQPPSPVSQISALPTPAPSVKPEFVADKNGKPERVIHKDENGRAPFEIRHTPEGQITIMRTFRTDGALLKEEAFRDGKPVPLPK